MIRNIRKNRKSGFTLIELLLYVGLSAIILLLSALFINIILESRVRTQSINEVEGSARQAIQLIMQTIRNAEAVNSPVAGASAASLSLDVVTALNDPTVFDLDSGAIRIKEGSAANISITSSLVEASALSFQNLSKSGTPGIIRFTFTLSYKNPSGREEYDYSKVFIGSASLR